MQDNQARIRQLQRHAAEAFEVFLRADPGLGGSVQRLAGATAFRWPAVPAVLFNHVVGLGDDRRPEDGEIDELLAPYRAQNLPCYVQLSPLADGEELGRRLEDRGLTKEPSWSVLALAPDRWARQTVQSPISVEPVDERNRDEFVRVMGEAFHMQAPIDRMISASLGAPDTFSFLARYQGEPAGSGQLIVRAGVGGLFSGGVLERFRRRGLHGALVAARVQHALDRGLQLLSTETEEVGNQSSRDLQRRGFVEAYEHVNWAMSNEP